MKHSGRDGHHMSHKAHSKHHGHKDAHVAHDKMKHEHMKKQHEHGRGKVHPSGQDYHDSASVSDNHQQGIARKTQRPGEMEVGHSGKMHWSEGHRESFHRSGHSLTPRKG